MSITKSSMIMAFLALFVCMSSTVMAAGTVDPGNPFNCATLKATCKTIADASYAKNASYSGMQAQCNVTNLSNASPHIPRNNPQTAKPLCGVNVICTATFLIEVSGTNPPAVPTTTSAAPATPTNGTTPAVPPKPAAPNGMYTLGTVDLTPQVLEQYDTSKCPTSAASHVKAASSVAAMVVVASVVAFMSSML
ncbi:hypothetical protein EC991_002172 [Linnemannia zychae]|nr:hypothetical protein EC991_002172 [Linnemannia zychae]